MPDGKTSARSEDATTVSDMQVLSREKLLDLAAELAPAFAAAQPYPHTVIDELFPPELLEQVIAEFPKPEDIPWEVYTEEGNAQKLTTGDERLMGPNTQRLLMWLNSRTIADFLEVLTGIKGLVGDPHLWGGGLHQIERGGFLNVHADFNVHPRLHLDRRINLLLYLNHDWRDEYAGHLELWDSEMTRCVTRIAPEFNRCVIFSTGYKQFHGHPDALACPLGMTRRSVAMYYYSKGRPEEEQSKDHLTLYQKPGEVTAPEPKHEFVAPPKPWKKTAERWLPPVLSEAGRKWARRRRERPR
ncbi:MAG: 2OG-Fe(II) oxygenase [Actinomycetota bacterium]